jgi:hypothetical protein
MANRKRFYLGRPGRVDALDSLTRASNPSATETIVGAVNRSLSGRTTRDVFAVKRSWSLTWDRILNEDAYQRLRAYLRANPTLGPFRFVDLRNRNLARAGVSLGGSDWLDKRDFEVVNTGVNSTGAFVWVTDVAWNPEVADHIDGGCRWTITPAGVPVLRDKATVVVWPTSVYRFSFYAYGTGSVQVRVRNLGPDGAELSTTNGPTIALNGTKTRYEYTYTPPAGTAEAQFGLQAVHAGSLIINTTAWYYGVDEPSMQPWVVGNGTPEVLLDLTTSYPWPGQYQCVLTVQEV